MSEARASLVPGAQDAAHVPAEHERPPLLPDGYGGFRKPILLLGTTIASTAVRFVLDQARYLSSIGWDVHIVCAPTQGIEVLRECEVITVHEISMSRQVSPLRDVISLVQWIKVIRSIKPDIVMSGTPKAGLLGMVASWITRVRVRIYLLRGLRSDGLRGRQQLISAIAERLTARTSTHILSVSTSLQSRYSELRIACIDRIFTLGRGSSNGVNLEHFRPPSAAERRAARERWSLPSHAVVLGFVGRLVADKGIQELLDAFAMLGPSHQYRLLLVGAEDFVNSGQRRSPSTLNPSRNIIMTGQLADPRDAYWAMDIFVLPSHREGFPNVALEAAATGRVVVTTTAVGCTDAVIPGVTGILVHPGDGVGLASAIQEIANQPNRAKELGRRGRRYVSEEFAEAKVWNRINAFLSRLLSEARPDFITGPAIRAEFEHALSPPHSDTTQDPRHVVAADQPPSRQDASLIALPHRIEP